MNIHETETLFQEDRDELFELIVIDVGLWSNMVLDLGKSTLIEC